MSEYQYYEFRTVDRALSPSEQAALRAVSSRAEISARVFRNSYHWGDLKADPSALLQRYFDVHVYVASWSGWCFALRLPAEALSAQTIKAYRVSEVFEQKTVGAHRLLTWCEQENADSDRYAMVEGEGWMARLLPLRKEILSGDLRPLYLGWLAAASAGELDEDVREPPRPPGLNDLSEAQLALVEFLGIDPDLCAAAGADEPQSAAEEPADLAAAFLATLGEAELRATCAGLLLEPAKAGASLQRSFTAWREKRGVSTHTGERRTLSELCEQASAARQRRQQREQQSTARAEAKQARQRAQKQATMAANAAKHWQAIEALAGQQTGPAYKEATALLVELRAACQAAGEATRFTSALRRFQSRHAGRQALLKRLREAGVTD